MHFQGEQHGKGPVDRLFGWGCSWIEDFLQRKPIHGIKDLIACYKAGAQYMVNSDPDGPKFHVEQFDPGETRPAPRWCLNCPGFLITRTYCMQADLTGNSRFPIRIKNNVFSDSNGEVLRGWEVQRRGEGAGGEEDEEDEAPSKFWRRGFWNAEKSWEGTGPKPGDVNEVVRRHAAQKAVQPPAPRPFQSDIDRALSSAALRLQQAALKKRRQHQHLQANRTAASSSSSSSSTSSSSDSDS